MVLFIYSLRPAAVPCAGPLKGALGEKTTIILIQQSAVDPFPAVIAILI